MKKLVNDDMEYDLPNILQYHITPGRMYIDAAATSSDGSTNRDAKLQKLDSVKSFGCGNYHTLVSVVGDTVYACGLNNYGQLGLSNAENGEGTVRAYLTEVPRLCGQGIICFKGGMHHSLAMTSHGALLAFGRSDSGQLGSRYIALHLSHIQYVKVLWY